MVATTAPVSIPNNTSALLLPSIVSGRGAVVRFTVDDVLAMIRQGILAEDATTELLNGFIVHKDRAEQGGDPTMHGPKHRACVRRLTRLAGHMTENDYHGQVQLPVVCSHEQMPEPDFAIVRGTDSDYRDRLPGAADVYCVIEAADSSLERDEGEKLPIYAVAGIPQYIILNLRNDSAQLYAAPDPSTGVYRDAGRAQRGATLRLNAGPFGMFSVALDELLP